MDINSFLTSLSIGLGVGIAVMLVVTVIFMPVAWVMNKNIHHHPMLRLLIGFATVFIAPIAFIIVLFQGATQYFGLMPLMKDPSAGASKEGGIIMPMFWKLVAIILHPFVAFNDDPTDNSGFIKSFDYLIAKTGEKTVDEGLTARAAVAGAVTDKDQWRTQMQALTGPFQEYWDITAAPAAAPRHDE